MPVSADWNAHANWRRARTRFRPAAACGCSRPCHARASSAKGKDFDTGNVLGPCIVTSDELSDPYALTLEARVNGELWGAGRTRDMHHRWEDVIAHVSRSETLYAGEVIGAGRSPTAAASRSGGSCRKARSWKSRQRASVPSPIVWCARDGSDAPDSRRRRLRVPAARRLGLQQRRADHQRRRLAPDRHALRPAVLATSRSARTRGSALGHAALRDS